MIIYGQFRNILFFSNCRPKDLGELTLNVIYLTPFCCDNIKGFMNNLIKYFAFFTLAASSLSAGRLSVHYLDVSLSQMDFEVSSLDFDNIGLEVGLNMPLYSNQNYGLDLFAEVLNGRLDGPATSEVSIQRFDLMFRPYYRLDSSSFFANIGYSSLSSNFSSVPTGSSTLIDDSILLLGLGFETSLENITFSPQIEFSDYGIPGEGLLYSLPISYKLSDLFDINFKYEFSDFDSFVDSSGNTTEAKINLFHLGLGYKF